jgi:hypothetical protein
MRYSCWSVVLLIGTYLAAAQTQEPPTTPPADTAAQSAPLASKPVDKGPSVDGAKVNGSTFESDFFKLTYQLPKDWKAMDDDARMAANARYIHDQEETTAPVAMPVPKKKTAPKPASAKPASTNTPAAAQIKSAPLETYSLMVASPDGVPSLDSPVLPRINIWAHKRVPPLDSIEDHAQFLLGTRRAQVAMAPQKVEIGGHEFIRADIIMPDGVYRSQFVTAVNDYLVGFEFQALSQREANEIIETTKNIKFQ